MPSFVVLTALLALAAPAASAAPTAGGLPHYDHVFMMVEENHGYQDIIGNPAAPTINALAQHYGLATEY